MAGVHDHVHAEALGTVYTLANLGVFAAYVTVPFTRMGRSIPLTRRVRVAGVLFFMTCAFTHVSMAFGWGSLWLAVAVDVLQAGAAWYFVLGFSSLLAAAAEVRRRRGPPADEDTDRSRHDLQGS